MAHTILLEVVTPEHLLLSRQVEEVIAPGVEGEFGVLPGHTHFLTILKIGELRYRVGEQMHYMSVLWGFAEVTPTKVKISRSPALKPPSRKQNGALKWVGFPQMLKPPESALKKPVSANASPNAH